MKKFNLIFLSLFLVIISCNKEEFTEVTQPQKHVSSSNENDSPEQSGIDISQLEYYADIHNELLAHLGSFSDLDELSFEQKYDIGEAYMSTNYPSFSVPDMEDCDMTENLPRTLSDMADSLFNEEIISDYAKGKFIDFEILLFNNFYVADINDLKDSLNAFEEEINESENLTLYEKKIIISASVISRYSCGFWADVVSSQSENWYEVVTSDNINNSLLPASYKSAYNNLDTPQSARLPWRSLYDLVKFVEWSADCDGSWQPNSCYQWMAYHSWVASGW